MEYRYNTSSSFTLLGIDELGGFQYLYSPLILLTYLFILLMSSSVIFVILRDESLHEPMYTFIANLMVNGIFGSSSFFPKLAIDLLFSTKVISQALCFIQTFIVTLFAYCETTTFSVMAYDTYLAVCHPLHYASLMRNETALKLIVGFLILNLAVVSTGTILSSRLPLCGTNINSVFCDNMSIMIMSCVDNSLPKLYGTINSIVYLFFTANIIAYSYLQIFLICFKISKDASKKAIYTLVTHFLNFSIFMVGVLFIFVRYRLQNVNLPVTIHVLLSVNAVVFPPLLNPLIYGIRTKALRIKLVCYLQKLNW